MPKSAKHKKERAADFKVSRSHVNLASDPLREVRLAGKSGKATWSFIHLVESH